jgi:hypothetical protein
MPCFFSLFARPLLRKQSSENLPAESADAKIASGTPGGKEDFQGRRAKVSAGADSITSSLRIENKIGN